MSVTAQGRPQPAPLGLIVLAELCGPGSLRPWLDKWNRLEPRSSLYGFTLGILYRSAIAGSVRLGHLSCQHQRTCAASMAPFKHAQCVAGPRRERAGLAIRAGWEEKSRCRSGCCGVSGFRTGAGLGDRWKWRRPKAAPGAATHLKSPCSGGFSQEEPRFRICAATARTLSC